MDKSSGQTPQTDTIDPDQVRPVISESQLHMQSKSDKNQPSDNHTDTDTVSEENSQAVDSQVEKLTEQVAQAQDSLLRCQADYQNLQRRSQEERAKWMRLATQDLMTDLVQPLDHLSLAAHQLKDPGLNMTMTQLWEVLKQHGLKEIEPMGEEFDVKFMEVVERQGEGQTVLSVVKRGYVLNGEVIQHAKVVVGDKIKK